MQAKLPVTIFAFDSCFLRKSLGASIGAHAYMQSLTVWLTGSLETYSFNEFKRAFLFLIAPRSIPAIALSYLTSWKEMKKICNMQEYTFVF